MLAEVGLNEAAWSKFPAQLSGGEAQRAGIVRALINSPKIIFADEPTGTLNSAASDGVLDVMTAVNQNGQSIVMVTHDIKTALRGNRVLYLRDGVICGDLKLKAFHLEHGPARQEKEAAYINQPYLPSWSDCCDNSAGCRTDSIFSHQDDDSQA